MKLGEQLLSMTIILTFEGSGSLNNLVKDINLRSYKEPSKLGQILLSNVHKK